MLQLMGDEMRRVRRPNITVSNRVAAARTLVPRYFCPGSRLDGAIRDDIDVDAAAVHQLFTLRLDVCQQFGSVLQGCSFGQLCV